MAKIKHIAIATQEPEKTASFYKKAFDLEEVGRVDNANAEGYYLSDGSVNLAVLRFKNEAVVGAEYGLGYSGIHHIGFQVEDMESAQARLRDMDARPRTEANAALKAHAAKGRGRRNVELKYTGPDGVIIDVSQSGWVGTD